MSGQNNCIHNGNTLYQFVLIVYFAITARYEYILQKYFHHEYILQIYFHQESLQEFFLSITSIKPSGSTM